MRNSWDEPLSGIFHFPDPISRTQQFMSDHTRRYCPFVNMCTSCTCTFRCDVLYEAPPSPSAGHPFWPGCIGHPFFHAAHRTPFLPCGASLSDEASFPPGWASPLPGCARGILSALWSILSARWGILSASGGILSPWLLTS